MLCGRHAEAGQQDVGVWWREPFRESRSEVRSSDRTCYTDAATLSTAPGTGRNCLSIASHSHSHHHHNSRRRSPLRHKKTHPIAAASLPTSLHSVAVYSRHVLSACHGNLVRPHQCWLTEQTFKACLKTAPSSPEGTTTRLHVHGRRSGR